ncbi:hypothetical protein LEP1GSC133_4323 [Leptospira borgpetersenii serovar Pomona str. 200901868]|uniref:Uncharacterized protein n=1 Tax=Leptospira borgpetersenii serovar Pomona str. 200901868 TaxID=1192866 RepID=M6WC84_LEPBO|nr:hypothetical protein LEP1GSC133_4323 [Leptospira borgpetersenii serovar Pomona str. 200901868]
MTKNEDKIAFRRQKNSRSEDRGQTNFASLVLDRGQKWGSYCIADLECGLRRQKREQRPTVLSPLNAFYYGFAKDVNLI